MAIYFKENGQWKLVKEPYIKRNGQWILPDEGYIKDGGTWKLFFKNFEFSVLTLQPEEVTATQITLEGALDGSANGISSVPDSADVDFEYSQGTSVGTNPDAIKTPVVDDEPQSSSESGNLANGDRLKTHDTETDDNDVAEFELTLDINDNDGFALTSDQDIAYRAVVTTNSGRFVGPTIQASTDPYTINVTTSTPNSQQITPDSVVGAGSITQLTGYQQGDTRFYYQKPSIYDLSANTPLTLNDVGNAIEVTSDQIPTADVAPDYNNQPDNPDFSETITGLDNESDYQIVAAARPADPSLDPGSDTDDIFFGSVQPFSTPPPEVNVTTNPSNNQTTASGADVTFGGSVQFVGVDQTSGGQNKTADFRFLYREQGDTSFQTLPAGSAGVSGNQTINFNASTTLTENRTYEYRAEVTLNRPNKPSGDITNQGSLDTVQTTALVTADLTVNGNENTNTQSLSKAFFNTTLLGVSAGVGGQNSGVATLDFLETNNAGDYDVTDSSTSSQFNGTNQNFDGRWETTASDDNFSVEYPFTVPSGGSTTKGIEYDADEQSGKSPGDVDLNGGFETTADTTVDDPNTSNLELNLSTREEWAPAVSKNSGDAPDSTTGLSSVEYDFGTIRYDDNPQQQTLTLYEVGGSNGATVDVSISQSGNIGQFELSTGGNSATNSTISGVGIPAGGSTGFTIDYITPDEDTSLETATITFEFLASNNPGLDASQTFKFTTDAEINVDAPNVNVVGSFNEFTASPSNTSETQTIQVEETTGNTSLTVSNVSVNSVSGTTGGFTLDSSSSFTVPAGGSDNIQVTFDPAGNGSGPSNASGDFTDYELTFQTDDPDSQNLSRNLTGRPQIEFFDIDNTFRVDVNSSIQGTSTIDNITTTGAPAELYEPDQYSADVEVHYVDYSESWAFNFIETITDGNSTTINTAVSQTVTNDSNSITDRLGATTFNNSNATSFNSTVAFSANVQQTSGGFDGTGNIDSSTTITRYSIDSLTVTGSDASGGFNFTFDWIVSGGTIPELSNNDDYNVRLEYAETGAGNQQTIEGLTTADDSATLTVNDTQTTTVDGSGNYLFIVNPETGATRDIDESRIGDTTDSGSPTIQ